MARDDGRSVSSATPSSADIERDVREDWDNEAHSSARRVLQAGKMTGERVRNAAGEDVGRIEEIMIDVSTGRVAYAVLSFGGFLGLGNKLFAIPWEALQLNQRDHEFILHIDRQQLENAPEFDKEHWPDMADRAWGSQLFAHYGVQPYWAGQAGAPALPRDAASTTKGETKMAQGQNRSVCECGKEFNSRQELEQHRRECPMAQSQQGSGSAGGKTRSMGSGSKPDDISE